MTTGRTICLYYELERVGPADVQRALSMVGDRAGELLHVCWDDASWEVPGTAAETVESARSDRFRTALSAELDELARSLRADRWVQRIQRHLGTDLAEVGWFDWLFAVAPAAHRPWALDQVRARWDPSEVVIVEPPGRAREGGAGRARRAARVTAAWLRFLVPRHQPLPIDGRPMVVFAEDFPHLAAVLAPPARRLHDAGSVQVHLLGTRPEVASVGSSAGVPSTLRDSGVPRWVRARALLAGGLAARAAGRAARRAGQPPEAIDGTAAAWRRAGRAAVQWRTILRRLDPAVVVTGTYTGNAEERAALLAGPRAADRPRTAFVQHGLVSPEPWKNRLIHDRYLVWGAQARRVLVEAGADEGSVVMTGSAKLAGPRTAPRAGGRPDGAVRVLYLPSRTAGRYVTLHNARVLLARVLGAVAGVPGATLTVKVHPEDRSTLFDDLDGIEVRRDGTAPALIAEADVVVVATSTAGYEACLLDTAVVVLAVPGVDPPTDYAAYGAALSAETTDDLARAIRDAAGDPTVQSSLAEGRQRLVADVFGPVDGDPTGRICAELARLAGASAPEPSAGTRTCVYYDLEEVTDGDRARALALVSACDPVDLVAEGTAWAASGTAEVVAGQRSVASRRTLMHVVGSFIDAARAEAPEPVAVAGVDLAEVGRYGWYELLRVPVQRARAAIEIAERFAPCRLVWVPPAGRALDDAGALRDWLAGRGVDLLVAGRSGAPDRQGGARRAVRQAAALARSTRRTLRADRTPLDRVDAVFAEHFERGSRVARLVADAAPADRCIAVVATRPEAAADAGSAVERLEQVTSRSARLAALLTARRAARAGRRLRGTAIASRTSGLAAVTATIAPSAIPAVAGVWAEAGAAAVLWDDVLGRADPAVVASTTNAPTPVRAAMAVARRHGRATVLVQHGMLTTQNPDYLDHDRYLVWGRADAEAMAELGVDPGHVVVTGPPTLDGLAERAAAARRDRARAEPAAAPRIVYFPSRSGGRFVSDATAKAMLDAVEQASRRVGAHLVVKVHPSDDSEVFAASGAEVVRGGDAHRLVEAADVVVVATSTVGFEACALDRPVVVLAAPGVPPPPEYERHGAAAVAADAEGLVAAVERSLADLDGSLRAGRAALVDAVFGGLRPGAARRSAEALLDAAADAPRAGG